MPRFNSENSDYSKFWQKPHTWKVEKYKSEGNMMKPAQHTIFENSESRQEYESTTVRYLTVHGDVLTSFISYKKSVPFSKFFLKYGRSRDEPSDS